MSLGASHEGLGRGVATWDLNQDGWYDIVAGRMREQTVLYLGGPEGFTRAEKSVGLLGEFDAWGILVVDYDGDGDPDLYVSRAGFDDGEQNSLLRLDKVEDGVPKYTDVSLESGAADPGASITSIAADYDRDGDVDIYVINGAPYMYDRPHIKTNALLRNNGDGTFTDVASAAGVAHQGNGMTGCWGDFNQDGNPDLFLINLYQENLLFLNRGDGTFEDATALSGLALPLRSWTTLAFDYDADGDLDLYVSPWNTLSQIDRDDVEGDRLYRNRGDATFEDVTQKAGLGENIAGMSVTVADFDANGWLDLYIGNGGPERGRAEPNTLYLNHGDGTFTDFAEAAGVAAPERTHGLSVADYDQDGDLDLYLSNGAMQGESARERSALYLNESPQPRRMLYTILQGAGMNRYAVGAEVTLFLDDGSRQFQVVTAGLGFGSQNPAPLAFGLGNAHPRRLVVKWPLGARTIIDSFLPGRTLRIVENPAEPSVSSSQAESSRHPND